MDPATGSFAVEAARALGANAGVLLLAVMLWRELRHLQERVIPALDRIEAALIANGPTKRRRRPREAAGQEVLRG